MYTAFFGLREEPFSIVPAPRFLYMSDKHREALPLMRLSGTGGSDEPRLTRR
jgi:general secretion pathway protein A